MIHFSDFTIMNDARKEPNTTDLRIDTGAKVVPDKRKVDGPASSYAHAADAPMSTAELCYERALYVVFVGIVGCAVLVVLYGIGMEYAVLQVHPAVLYLLLFGALTLLGYVEALHYSNVAIERYDMSPFAERCVQSIA